MEILGTGTVVLAVGIVYWLMEGQDGRQRLLIADDNSDMRDYLRSLLKTRYEVETAAGLLRSKRPRLAVLTWRSWM